MGDEFLTVSPPEEEEGEAEQTASPCQLSQLFARYLPFYLSIGMTPEQYYNGDYELVKAYRESHEIEKKRKNELLWLQGLYVYRANCASSPFSDEKTYLDEPIPLSKEEMAEAEERKLRRKQEEMYAKLLARTKK